MADKTQCCDKGYGSLQGGFSVDQGIVSTTLISFVCTNRANLKLGFSIPQLSKTLLKYLCKSRNAVYTKANKLRKSPSLSLSVQKKPLSALELVPTLSGVGKRQEKLRQFGLPLDTEGTILHR